MLTNTNLTNLNKLTQCYSQGKGVQHQPRFYLLKIIGTVATIRRS